ncbi:MAG: hypothetical protein Tp1123DCM257201_2 [Prokaryotic dsDNA virus sp.]|nr:MAG: hypothetical protein Tp1123DCM257201_2 [Prokaryotic dsDNA virus sp.]|tara:strand:+ start:720 stop:1814 length:1095 start_codon:yes stop_codon:yes gene_type:complete
MAVSPDVVATALNELMPSYSELFVKYHPLLEKVLKGGNMDRAALKGPKRDFAVVTDGPGTVTEISTGSEVIAGGRRQNAHRGQVIAPRLIYAFDVPGKDLAEANGEMDLARILQHYPELALDDFHTRISNQLGTGNGTGVGGFMTLNGTTAFSNFTPQGESRRGILQAVAPASQAQTIHNLVQADVAGWSNQYQDITSFAVDGRSQMRKAYYAASRQGKTLGPVDLMLGDEASYLNYIDDLDDAVRVVKIEGDKAPANVRQGVKFLDADFYLDDSIDVAAQDSAGNNLFSTAAQDGMIYGLKTPTWYQFTLGHDASKETKGDFAVRGPFRIPDQDVYRYELVLMMGMHTTQLRANFVVTGAGTA